VLPFPEPAEPGPLAHNNLETLALLQAAGSEVWFCPHTPRNSNLSTYMPQLKNGWKSTETDPMGPWKGFCNLPGFTWRVKAKVDFGGNAAADVSG
jgi:hypothetical protein